MNYYIGRWMVEWLSLFGQNDLQSVINLWEISRGGRN